MKPCFGYIRVSTQKQGEGVSLEAQKDAITVFASRNNLTVSKWFEEKETAAKRGRPVFSNMLNQLRQHKAEGVIIHKIDRSARNLRDWAMFSELPDIGVSVYIATENMDFNSRGGRLTADIQAVIAADYIRNLREECIKGLNGRLKQGLYPFRAPIGYQDNGRGKPKTPCPKKGPLVRQVFDLYVSGKHSINSLVVEMEQLGLRGHTGKPLSKHGIETILRNPFYCGLIEIRRTGKTYTGIHNPIISAATFQEVQDIKAGKAGKKVTRHNHLYRGLFRCADCGTSMIPERQKGHVYYRCHKPHCPKNTIREDRLDAAIMRAYLRLEITAKDRAKLKADWLVWLNSQARADVGQSISLRIANAEDRLHRLTDLLLDGVIEREEHAIRKKQLSLELATLKEERKERGKSDLSDDEIETFLELVSNLAELHILLKPDEKRYLLENCFSNLCVSENQPQFEPYSWLKSREFSELTPLVKHVAPLLELLSRLPMRRVVEDDVPQWKYNLKYQKPDDLPDVA